jgi:hypothetical protein
MVFPIGVKAGMSSDGPGQKKEKAHSMVIPEPFTARLNWASGEIRSTGLLLELPYASATVLEACDAITLSPLRRLL